MDVMICHLTRMSPPLICTAGLNLGNLRHVRPFPTSGHVNASHLHASGGILRLGRVVRFVNAQPCGRPPEIEDTRATFRTAQNLGELPAPEFWSRISRVAHAGPTALTATLGPDLHRVGSTFAVPIERGTASLSLLRCPCAAITLKVREPTRFNKQPQARAVLAPGTLDDAPSGPADLPITDIRFYGAAHDPADPQSIADANILLHNSPEAILAVGLSRAFSKGDGRPRHWLQVNGVFPSIDPLWNA
ncbi:MAG TPA: hypothetical protein PKE29_17730 [Phycisphaerales bacterium]|nr:hypothetical protein [Phycisphaerales bacterium]